MDNNNKSEKIKRQLGYVAAAFWAIVPLIYSFAMVLSDIDEFTIKIVTLLSVPVYIVLLTFYAARLHPNWCKKIDEKYNNNV